METRLWTDQTFLGGILDFKMGAGRRWRERWPSKIDSYWGKHCCCCWFGQKLLLNHIKNDSRIFEHPQDCSSSDSKRRYGKEEVVCTFCSTLLDTWAKGRSSNILPKLFNKIIMGEETWCFAYDPETKRQSSEWDGETSPWLKKLKFQRYRITTTLIIFFYSQGTVHKEFVPEGKTVNAEFYKRVMDCLPKCIQRVHPAVFCSRDILLLHNNAPAHKAASVCQFLTPKNVTTLFHAW